MSANTYAVDALTRHQIYIQRYSNGEIKRLLPVLSQMLKDIRTRINSEGVLSMGRMLAVEQDLSIIINQSVTKLGGKLKTDLNDLGEYEAGFTRRMLGNMVDVSVSGVTIDQVAAAINETAMTLVSGNNVFKTTIDQAITQFSGVTTGNVTRTIQTGIATGRTTSEISSEVARVVKHRTRAQAEALIRTAANHAGTVARAKVYEENSDFISGEEFVATLDSRTTLVCAGNDGKHFNVGEGPQPALHFNCRSIRVPVVDPAFSLAGLGGSRPSIGPDGVEIVSANTTYESWLKRQPVAFQNEALGVERAALFRRGGLSIDKFTDDRGIAYTLDKLKELEPTAFEVAGL